jgi:hypothetical protein
LGAFIGRLAFGLVSRKEKGHTVSKKTESGGVIKTLTSVQSILHTVLVCSSQWREKEVFLGDVIIIKGNTSGKA